MPGMVAKGVEMAGQTAQAAAEQYAGGKALQAGGAALEEAGGAVLSKLGVAEGEAPAALESGCFVSGTLVPTERGLIEIQDVIAGDRVWSYSMQEKEWQLRPVEAMPVRNYTGDVITIGVGDVAIEVTGNHPFWVISGEAIFSRPQAQDLPENERFLNTSGRWVEARSLAVGDEMFLFNNKTAKITSLLERSDHLLVYNLHVTDNHTYAVSQLGILVHNKGMQIKPIAGQNGIKALEQMSADERRAYFIKKGVPPNQLGPSGYPKVNVVEKATRKDTIDAARQAGGSKPIKHTQDAGQPTHYHATDESGDKLTGKDNVHYQQRGAKENP
jgi:hypothetical protein